MHRSRKVIAALAVALALGIGGAAYAHIGGGDGEVLDDVAAQLGIEPQELRDAFEAVALERLDEAVAQGRVSEERAADIRERIEAGELPFLGGHHGHGHHGGFEIFEAAAEYLELEPQALREELRSGMTLAEIATGQGKDRDGLVQALMDAVEERLDEAVANGRLTEDEKAERLARLEERIGSLVDGELDLRPGLRFHRGGPDEAPPDTAPDGGTGSTDATSDSI